MYEQIRWSGLVSGFCFYEHPRAPSQLHPLELGGVSATILQQGKSFIPKKSHPERDTVEANCSPALGDLGNQFALVSLVALRQDVGVVQVAGDTALPCAAGVLFRETFIQMKLTFATE